MNRLYLAKPYDKTDNFSSVEAEFIHTMNLKTPEKVFLSMANNLNRFYERIPDGLPQYFHYNDIEMEYIYPMDEKILSLSPLDISIPVLQPFRYTKFQKSLLKFDRIIFPDDDCITNIIQNHGLISYMDKFYALHDEKVRKEFMEYNPTDDFMQVKHYELSNILINAIKTDDFSALKYKK